MYIIRILEGLAQPQSTYLKTIMIDATYLKPTARHPVLGLKKGGAGSPDRSHKVGHEYQAAGGDRCEWSPNQLLHVRWASQRLHRCSRAARLDPVENSAVATGVKVQLYFKFWPNGLVID